MAERNKPFLKRRRVRWIAIPLLLFLFWVGATLWYMIAFDKSFLVVSYNHNENIYDNFSKEKILKGNKVSGIFKAEDNNLGIVAIRFQVRDRVAFKDEDSLVFRLKEQGAKNWYYENKYRSGFIYELPFLPFGFPVIKDSKNTNYYFELESLKGNSINGVELSDRSPVFASKYKFSKSELMKNKSLLVHFILRKVFNSMKTIDVAFSSFVFLMPLLIYLLWHIPIVSRATNPTLQRSLKRVDYYSGKYMGDSNARRIFLRNVTSASFIVIIIVVLIDIFFLQIVNDLLYIVIGMLWFYIMKGYKLNSKLTFSVGSLLLIIAPICLLFNFPSIADKTGAWAFIYYWVGVSQLLLFPNKVIKK